MDKIIEYGEFDVTEDRSRYIGGSDVPVIMGISPFKTRYQLLCEKAGLEVSGFRGTKFTQYGHDIEPKIREFVGFQFETEFLCNRVIDGDFRYHSDGFDGYTVLECKSTSEIHATLEGYKLYLVQLLKGMEENDVESGIFAVYSRPEDLSLEFDPNRLQIFLVDAWQYRPMLNKINREIDRFRADLERLKNNPLLTEQDFLPAPEGLVTLADKVVAFEKQLASMKEIELKCKEAKAALHREMEKRGVKSWTLPSGTKITMVAGTEASVKTVREFDVEALKIGNPGIYERYCRVVEKKVPGKAGYVRITVPR